MSSNSLGRNFSNSFCGTLMYSQLVLVNLVAFSHHRDFAARSFVGNINIFAAFGFDKVMLSISSNRHKVRLVIAEGMILRVGVFNGKAELFGKFGEAVDIGSVFKEFGKAQFKLIANRDQVIDCFACWQRKTGEGEGWSL